ncbi:MAG: serine/threonine protein kinase [Cyanobacteria bacterium HKST-UBA02]|nr:serine/threonine protein kinase [Cyanobacteria bacterium HKST-UBA02]
MEIPDSSFPLERYIPLSVLGKGNAGTVYLAMDRLLEKRVAVKVIRLLSADQIVAFQQEAIATSKLRHSNIVEVLDLGLVDDSVPYMVLELVAGQSIAAILNARGRLPWQLVLQMAEQLCDALSYAHEQGVYHRDIQPDNVIVSESSDGMPSVRLIDFGIARIVQEITTALDPADGELAGVPLYMSPEPGLGLPYDARSEIYSLGCVMYHCLCGRPPLEGASALETLKLHATAMPPSLVEFAIESSELSAVPVSMEAIVMKCLAKNPDERYQSMRELSEALGQIDLGNSSVEESAPSVVLPVRKSASLTAVLAVLAGFLVVACVAGLSKQFLKRESKPDPLAYRRSILPRDVVDDKPTQDSAKFDTGEKEFRSSMYKNANWLGLVKQAAENSTRTPNSRAGQLIEMIPTGATEVVVNGRQDESYFDDLDKYTSAVLIDLSGSEVTDQTLAKIRSPRLRTLKLDKTSVVTLESVPRFAKLEVLTLDATAVDNQSIERLRRLRRLERLDISTTRVDDGVISVIRDLPSLLLVNASGSLSPSALKRLSEELPACRFVGANVSYQGVREPSREEPEHLQIKALRNCIAVIEKAQGLQAPYLAHLLSRLSGCFLREGHVQQAREASGRAVEIAQRSDSSHWLLESTLADLQVASKEKDLARSIICRRRYIVLLRERSGPGRSVVANTLSLANSYLQMGNREEAAERYHDVIQEAEQLNHSDQALSPGDTGLFVGVAWDRLARIDRSRKDLRLAEAEVRKAIDIWLADPAESSPGYQRGLVASYRLLSMIESDQKRFDEAIASQQKCVDLSRKYHLSGLDGHVRALEEYKIARDQGDKRLPED